MARADVPIHTYRGSGVVGYLGALFMLIVPSSIILAIFLSKNDLNGIGYAFLGFVPFLPLIVWMAWDGYRCSKTTLKLFPSRLEFTVFDRIKIIEYADVQRMVTRFGRGARFTVHTADGQATRISGFAIHDQRIYEAARYVQQKCGFSSQ